MTREEALKLLKDHLKNKNLINHCIAAEVVMQRLAKHFSEDEEIWGLAGLLHDIDYDDTKDDPATHSIKGSELLEKLGLPSDVVYAVKVHNEYHGLPRESRMDKALYAVDPLTGLIVAGVLIKPEKKLAAIDTAFLLNRFNEKSFARGANRDQISSCSEFGLTLEEFIGFGLEAMQENHAELGL
ncbi:MAG: HDIG domain-containing protein [Desulfitobacterium hafniense]|nr:HDIG domain-containing protein [Desulfitobacterium hafniense]